MSIVTEIRPADPPDRPKAFDRIGSFRAPQATWLLFYLVHAAVDHANGGTIRKAPVRRDIAFQRMGPMRGRKKGFPGRLLAWAGVGNVGGMETNIGELLVPGARVKVIQQIGARAYSWSSEIRGVVVSFEQRPTGSWFAHSRDDRLWLDRLTIKKDDGELTTLNLDEFSVVRVEAPPAVSPAPKAA